MEIELYWDDGAGTTMVAVLPEHWTWAEANRALMVVNTLANDPQATMQAAIVDVRVGVNLPDPIWSPTTLKQARQIAAMAPQGTGPVVVVGVNPLVRSSFEVFRSLYPRATANVHVTTTMPKARQIIARQIAAGQVPARRESA